MNAECQRLEPEANDVQNQIDELVKSCGQMVNGTRFPIVDLTLRVRQASRHGIWHSSLGE